MSRAFTPPSTLSKDDIRKVADVRRTLWLNGMIGMVGGTATGLFGHVVLKALQDRKKFTLLTQKALPPLGRNTLFLAFLGGGALGSFAFSAAAGINSAHLLHPIFEKGRDKDAGKTEYQKAVREAKASPSKTREGEGGAELDAAHHRTRSLQRATSIRHRLEHGRSLADSHNNQWAQSAPVSQTPGEEEEEKSRQKNRASNRADAFRRRQTERKKWVSDKIERGHALSDSTGGHWAKGEEEERGASNEDTDGKLYDDKSESTKF